MTIIRRARPFDEFLTFHQALDRLFDDSVVGPHAWRSVTAAQPALDARATADEVVVRASLPGWKPGDVELTLTGSTLTLSGATTDDSEREEGSWMLREIRHGSFSRTVQLPDGLESDEAGATFEDGVLTVRIPKAERSKPRNIPIGATSEAKPAPEAVGAGGGR